MAQHNYFAIAYIYSMVDANALWHRGDRHRLYSIIINRKRKVFHKKFINLVDFLNAIVYNAGVNILCKAQLLCLFD